jgi:hypothetical protein
MLSDQIISPIPHILANNLNFNLNILQKYFEVSTLQLLTSTSRSIIFTANYNNNNNIPPPHVILKIVNISSNKSERIKHRLSQLLSEYEYLKLFEINKIPNVVRANKLIQIKQNDKYHNIATDNNNNNDNNNDTDNDNDSNDNNNNTNNPVEETNNLIMVCNYFPGIPLSQVIPKYRGNGFTLNEFFQIALTLTETIGLIHQQQIIHGIV